VVAVHRGWAALTTRAVTALEHRGVVVKHHALTYGGQTQFPRPAAVLALGSAVNPDIQLGPVNIAALWPAGSFPWAYSPLASF